MAVGPVWPNVKQHMQAAWVMGSPFAPSLGSAVGDVGFHACDAFVAVPDGRVAYWIHLAM